MVPLFAKLNLTTPLVVFPIRPLAILISPSLAVKFNRKTLGKVIAPLLAKPILVCGMLVTVNRLLFINNSPAVVLKVFCLAFKLAVKPPTLD